MLLNILLRLQNVLSYIKYKSIDLWFLDIFWQRSIALFNKSLVYYHVMKSDIFSYENILIFFKIPHMTSHTQMPWWPRLGFTFKMASWTKIHLIFKYKLIIICVRSVFCMIVYMYWYLLSILTQNAYICRFLFCSFWGFSSDSIIFHLYGAITIAGEALQISTYAQHSFFSVPHPLWHGTPVYDGHLRGQWHSNLMLSV